MGSTQSSDPSPRKTARWGTDFEVIPSNSVTNESPRTGDGGPQRPSNSRQVTCDEARCSCSL